jgi:hypothetical protein
MRKLASSSDGSGNTFHHAHDAMGQPAGLGPDRLRGRTMICALFLLAAIAALAVVSAGCCWVDIRTREVW